MPGVLALGAQSCVVVLDSVLGEGSKVASGIIFSWLADLLTSPEKALGWKEQRPDPEEEPFSLPLSQGWLFLSQMWLQRGL